MDGLIAIADAIDRIAGERHRRLSPEERIEIDDVLYAADDYANNRMPLEAFAKIGTIESPYTGRVSPAYTRYLAMLATPLSDPRRKHLMRAIDGLIRFQGLEITTHGLFDHSELKDIRVINAPDPWPVQARKAAAA